MVKVTKDLQSENEALQQKVKTLEALQKPQESDPKLARYMDELKKIKTTARNEGNQIKIKEYADHKNISLWVTSGINYGKRIGPLHQTNAETTFKLCWDRGIRLTVDRPTPEQITAYKETEEYREALAKHLKLRGKKDKSKKSGQIEKLAAEIAKMTGQTVEVMNKILAPGEVRKVNA